MGVAVQSQEGATRPLCACHGVPRYKSGDCAVSERERNARRIRIMAGGYEIFVGRAPSADTTEAVRSFIQQHKQEVKDGWLHA